MSSTFIAVLAQFFGIIGFIFCVLSFQSKENKNFFIMQGSAGLMFFLNFILIGAVSAALFNLTNLLRGMLLMKNDKKIWRLIVIEAAYIICFIISLMRILDQPFQIFLSSLTLFALLLPTVFMWLGNGKHIRYVQFCVSSPSWIIHNIFNFSLGGLLCESFSMASVIVSFIRYGKDGFEK